jgi:HK97 gp10 family phage protein
MKLVSNFKALARKAPIAAGKALVQTGKDIASLASQLAPVDEGDLRDSYDIQIVSETTVLVGSPLKYAGPVEFGFIHYKSGEHIPAQPHLTPAFHQSRATFVKNLKKEIKEAANG